MNFIMMKEKLAVVAVSGGMDSYYRKRCESNIQTRLIHINYGRRTENIKAFHDVSYKQKKISDFEHFTKIGSSLTINQSK